MVRTRLVLFGVLLVGGVAHSENPPVAIYDVHVDHLGNVRAVTDEDGFVVSTHEFLPFGEEVLPMRSQTTKRFTGHERDEETNLDYMLARYYSNQMARFLSVDPATGRAAAPQSWNRYSYVQNMPLGFVDPDGRYLRSVTTSSGKTRTRQSELRSAVIKAHHNIGHSSAKHLSKAQSLQQNKKVAYDVTVDDQARGKASTTKKLEGGFILEESVHGHQYGIGGERTYEITIPTDGLEGDALVEALEDALVHELTEVQTIREDGPAIGNTEAHEEAEEVEEEHREQREQGKANTEED